MKNLLPILAFWALSQVGAATVHAVSPFSIGNMWEVHGSLYSRSTEIEYRVAFIADGGEDLPALPIRLTAPNGAFIEFRSIPLPEGTHQTFPQTLLYLNSNSDWQPYTPGWERLQSVVVVDLPNKSLVSFHSFLRPVLLGWRVNG